MSIADLHPGQEALIVKVRGDGPIRRRLLDMGLTPGTKIRMLQPAPSGDPVSIFIRSFELSLRRRDALNVEIAGTETAALPERKTRRFWKWGKN